MFVTEKNELISTSVLVDPHTLLAAKEEKVICEVCGHANPEFVSICQMCSNYLKGMR